jgi:hypothetical protein
MERILFSDVDGTLVHYPPPEQTENVRAAEPALASPRGADRRRVPDPPPAAQIPHDSDIIKLPVSTSGMQVRGAGRSCFPQLLQHYHMSQPLAACAVHVAC